MLWIKRNLFLAVGGLIALVLVGFGGYYWFSAVQRSKEVDTQLAEARAKLEGFYKQTPFPAQTNVTAAQEQTQRIHGAITNVQKYFSAVPYQNAKDVEFTRLLDNAIDELNRKATNFDIKLPEAGGKGYAFSFQAQRGALKFPEGSFPALPQQLAEVKTICNELFDARITHLLSVRRPSPSGEGGSGDYHNYKVETNATTGHAVMPYEVTFACFSKGLADAMQKLSTSEHGFIVKPLQIEPLSAADAAVRSGIPGAPPPPGGIRLVSPRGPGGALRPGRPPSGHSEEWASFLEEGKFKVTLLVELVKPAQ